MEKKSHVKKRNHKVNSLLIGSKTLDLTIPKKEYKTPNKKKRLINIFQV